MITGVPEHTGIVVVVLVDVEVDVLVDVDVVVLVDDVLDVDII